MAAWLLISLLVASCTTSQATAPNPIPTVGESSASSSEQDATPSIVAAANAFLETLNDTEKDTVLFDWTDTAQKQRWSNFPDGPFERAGLMWGNMSETQQVAWLKVMQATLSTSGYNRIIAQWNGDDVVARFAQDGGGILGSIFGGGGASFGTAYYYIAIMGTPSETEPWQWQWGGHHVTVNATIVGPNIALTPSYMGLEPVEYTDASGNTVRPLGDIEDDAFALINSLDSTQQEAAILGSEPINVVLGPGEEGKTIQPEGVPASQMTASQQATLMKLIGHYAGLLNDEDAAVRMAEISETLDETYLAWYGPTNEDSPAYFRVTGPTLLIEYSPQGDRGSAPGSDYHVHGIYRDPTNDYGAKYAQ